MEKKANLTNPPTAEKILSILADLYADQMGVKVKYTIENGGNHDEKKAG